VLPNAQQIRIWHYPETARPPVVVDTRHQANLFGVRFLPCTNNLQLVSGAMDYTVQVTCNSGWSFPQAHAAECTRIINSGMKPLQAWLCFCTMPLCTATQTLHCKSAP